MPQDPAVPVVAFAISLTLAAYLLLTIWLSHRRHGRFSRIAYVEETRSHWAEARALLVELARDEKVDPRSATFRTLYQLQTFVLRRPGAYGEIAKLFRVNILIEPVGTGAPMKWIRESQAWPAELNQVFQKMADGTWSLVIGYPGWGRLLRAGRIVLPGVAALTLHLLDRLSTRSEHARIERDLIGTHRRMAHLGRQTHFDTSSFSTSAA